MNVIVFGEKFFTRIAELRCGHRGPPHWLIGKESISSAWDSRDMDLIPGRSPGGGHGNPFQYSCLENPIVRGVRQTPRFIESQKVGHDHSNLACTHAYMQSLGWPDLIWSLSWWKEKFGHRHRHAQWESDKTQRRWPSVSQGEDSGRAILTKPWSQTSGPQHWHRKRSCSLSHPLCSTVFWKLGKTIAEPHGQQWALTSGQSTAKHILGCFALGLGAENVPETTPRMQTTAACSWIFS